MALLKVENQENLRNSDLIDIERIWFRCEYSERLELYLKARYKNLYAL